MAINLTETVWNGKYKVTNLEDVDTLLCIFWAQGIILRK
jgi:hypothetical protein